MVFSIFTVYVYVLSSGSKCFLLLFSIMVSPISFQLLDPIMFSRYVDSHISAQLRASMLLLLELLFIREGVFSCSF